MLFLFLFLPRNRVSTLRRIGVHFHCRPKINAKKTIWIHAVSICEISTSRPLIQGLKQTYADAEIFFSTISKEDEKTAQTILGDIVDHFIPLPLDIRFTINRFIRLISPDLLILVNTDLHPNILGCMRARKIPVILVNFKVSSRRNTQYKRFVFIFKPLFSTIHSICVQTETDRQKLIQLGVNQLKLYSLGDLTFDLDLYVSPTKKPHTSFILPESKQIIVAGTTHEGEEETILQCVKILQTKFPSLYLIIAPYNSSRGAAIHRMAKDIGLAANLRSQINVGGKDLLILDTSGELHYAYSLADISFVGGSMVNEGGNNPIEPAIYGSPVLFGKHMENYFKVSGELIHAGGAIMVRDQMELLSNLEALLKNPDWLQKKGTAARTYIQSKQGVTAKHLSIIHEIL